MEKERILELLPYDYEYRFIGECVYKNEQDFICTLNIKNVNDEEEAKKWISKLSKSTLTTWRVQRTYPESGRCNIYKIAMKCQHNVNHKLKTPEERKRNHVSKHTGCPSTLVLTVKRYVKKSKAKRRSSNSSLIEWPCFVDLKFTHNHPLNTAEVLRFRPIGNEIKEKLVMLFNKGHTAASALESIKMELFLENDENYYELASDRYYVPTISQIQYLFNNTFGVTGSKNTNCIRPTLEQLLKNYNESISKGRADVGLIGESKFVTICTPLMTRAHELLPQSCQTVIMETYGNLDKKGHKIYIMATPTPTGTVPLGCIITDTDKSEVLMAALANLKQCFPGERSFYGQNYPCVFMIGDDLKEQEPLKAHWPKSIVLVHQYNILKGSWNWLNCHQNVPKLMREEIYHAFKNLIYCSNEKELCNLYTNLVSKYQCVLPKFVLYLNSMWTSRFSWSSAYRNNVLNEKNESFNYIETTFKIMKDGILERIKNFDLTQLVDFILVHYEGYISRRFIYYFEGKICKRLLYKYIPPTCIINPSMIIHSNVDPMCYFVPSESDYNIKYMVDVKHCICSCDNGKGGRICKHLCGVINHLETPNDIIDGSQSFKDTLYRIATDNDPLSNTQVRPLATPPPYNIKTESDIADEVMSLSRKENENLLKFFDCINDGLKNKSELYVPAVKVMIKTFTKMKSETALLSAIKMFGKNTKRYPYNVANDDSGVYFVDRKYDKKKKDKRSNGIRKHYVTMLPKSKENEDTADDPLAV